MFENLKKLCLLDAISGREDTVRDYLISKISNFNDCTYFVDPLGNLIVDKKGKNTSSKKVMIASHMDEVGMVVKGINDNGLISNSTVGNIINAAGGSSDSDA